MTPLPLALTLLTSLSTLLPQVLAGTIGPGGACTQANNHLQLGTNQFDGDCDVRTFCADNSTCVPKGCRHDIFPFGYPQDDPNLPPLCPPGQFCPDEMDACQPVVAVGGACQLNRDDECEPPLNARDLRDEKYGLNSNGSVCLNFQCMFANVTVGLPCVNENTAYIVYGANNQESIQIISRGNCAPNLYCDAQQLVCMQTKNEGDSCSADKECSSMNCTPSQTCGKPIDAAQHFGIWVYIVVGVCIFGGMIATLIGLFFLHSKQREREREKRTQYWREQNAFRQNILQMRDTARASLLSLPLGNGGNSARSTIYSREGMSSEESQLPMLAHAGPKGSGLKHQQYAEETDREDYDSANIVRERENDGPRFRSARAF